MLRSVLINTNLISIGLDWVDAITPNHGGIIFFTSYQDFFSHWKLSPRAWISTIVTTQVVMAYTLKREKMNYSPKFRIIHCKYYTYSDIYFFMQESHIIQGWKYWLICRGPLVSKLLLPKSKGWVSDFLLKIYTKFYPTQNIEESQISC